jgi:hypothetical protein
LLIKVGTTNPAQNQLRKGGFFLLGSVDNQTTDSIRQKKKKNEKVGE